MALRTLRREATAPIPAGAAQRGRAFEFLARSPIYETLQMRDFRWIWVGSFASFMAMNMQMFARSWLVLRLEQDSPLALSLVMVSFAAPMTFVSLIGGALADRIPKKQLIMFSQVGNAILALMVGILDMSGVIWFMHIMIIGVVDGTLMALNMPSRQAIVSEVVPQNKLMNAVALNNSGMNLTRVLGPALAGFLIIFIDTAGMFFIIAGVYVLAALSMLMVNAGSKPAAKSNKSVTGDIAEGLKYASKSPTLLGLIIMAFIPSLFGFSYFALLPAWGREVLHVRSSDLGMLMVPLGLGALVGTLGLASIRSFNKRGVLLLANSLAWGVSLAVFSQTTSYGIAMPMLFVVGLLSSVYMSLNMTLVQLYSAPEMRGRVMSLVMMTFGLMPLGTVPFGLLAEYVNSTAYALMWSGSLLALITLIFIFAYPKFRKIA